MAKVLDSPTADQVFDFGFVNINSTPETLPEVHVGYRRAAQTPDGMHLFGVSTAMICALIQRLIEARFVDLKY